MSRYTIKANQSLFDIAIEVYGDVQGVSWLLEDNRFLPGPTGPLMAGEILEIRDTKMNVRLATYLGDFAPFQTVDAKDMPSGIGYWLTEDYII